MSERHGNPHPTDNSLDEGEQALSVLREIWSARAQTSADIDEVCGNTKVCKNMASVGFQGIAGDEAGNDLRAAWKTKLEREGKLHPEGKSVRDLVLRSSETTR